MKRARSLFAVGVALVGLVGLTGCDDFATPDGLVRTAAEKLEKKDLKGFQRTMAGDALKSYGTREDMTALSAKLGPIKELRTGKPELKWAGHTIGHGMRSVTVTEYTVGVFGKDQSAKLTATVDCESYIVRNDQPPRPMIPNDGYPCHNRPVGSYCNGMELPETMLISECLILKLE